MSRDLPGYSSLLETFEIEEVTVSSVNRPERVLFVRLRAKEKTGLNAAWWWNPLDGDVPRYTWTDFLDCFQRASEVVSSRPWFEGWLDIGPDRRLELHAFGCAPASGETELAYWVRPRWQDAGYSGRPEYEFVARRSPREWVTLYLGDSEGSALVGSTIGPDPDASHWLDRLDLNFHPRCEENDRTSTFATISSTGELQMRRLSHCEP